MSEETPLIKEADPELEALLAVDKVRFNHFVADTVSGTILDNQHETVKTFAADERIEVEDLPSQVLTQFANAAHGKMAYLCDVWWNDMLALWECDDIMSDNPNSSIRRIAMPVGQTVFFMRYPNEGLLHVGEVSDNHMYRYKQSMTYTFGHQFTQTVYYDPGDVVTVVFENLQQGAR